MLDINNVDLYIRAGSPSNDVCNDVGQSRRNLRSLVAVLRLMVDLLSEARPV